MMHSLLHHLLLTNLRQIEVVEFGLKHHHHHQSAATTSAENNNNDDDDSDNDICVGAVVTEIACRTA